MNPQVIDDFWNSLVSDDLWEKSHKYVMMFKRNPHLIKVNTQPVTHWDSGPVF